jgi:hypothetical protein
VLHGQKSTITDILAGKAATAAEIYCQAQPDDRGFGFIAAGREKDQKDKQNGEKGIMPETEMSLLPHCSPPGLDKKPVPTGLARSAKRKNQPAESI